jgi:hypothetical protein
MDSNGVIQFRSPTLANEKEFMSEEEIIQEGIRLEKKMWDTWRAYMFGAANPYQGGLIASKDEAQDAFSKFLFKHRKILLLSKEFNSK